MKSSVRCPKNDVHRGSGSCPPLSWSCPQVPSAHSPALARRSSSLPRAPSTHPAATATTKLSRARPPTHRPQQPPSLVGDRGRHEDDRVQDGRGQHEGDGRHRREALQDEAARHRDRSALAHGEGEPAHGRDGHLDHSRGPAQPSEHPRVNEDLDPSRYHRPQEDERERFHHERPEDQEEVLEGGDGGGVGQPEADPHGAQSAEDQQSRQKGPVPGGCARWQQIRRRDELDGAMSLRHGATGKRALGGRCRRPCRIPPTGRSPSSGVPCAARSRPARIATPGD